MAANLISRRSASGQQRKSSVSLKMSLVGGRAEVDFGPLDVSLSPQAALKLLPQIVSFVFVAEPIKLTELFISLFLIEAEGLKFIGVKR